MMNQSKSSPLRKMIANSQLKNLRTFKTLEDAKKQSNTFLVMDGDDGGQIYLVCPVSLVKCDENALLKILSELDARAWNDPSMASIHYEVYEPGAVVPGGMGGGVASTSLWLHKNFQELKMDIESRLYMRGEKNKS